MNLPIPTNNVTILIVDDTRDTRDLLTLILTSNGYTVRSESSGKQAINHVQETLPTLILLDIMMPDMDGYEVCTHLKQNEQTADIPIIFISAQDDVKNIVKSFYMGGVDYISKPFNTAEILARIEAHITMHHRKTDLEKQIEDLDAFAHTVAHDLKGPLSLVTGFSDYLLEIDDLSNTAEVLEVLLHIKKAGHRAVNIIDELLLLSGVKKKEALLSPVDMATVVRKSQQRLEFMIAEHKGYIQLPLEWPTALGYGAWLEEVWVNYISNGLKYGGSEPQLTLGAEALPNDIVRFWISDNGNGISPTQQAAVFSEFERLDQMHAEGHGLGLSIVRRIIHKLGGTVGVESIIGEGSLFYFTLPAAPDALE